MHFTAPCISSVGIYDVSWWSSFPSSTVCFVTVLPCAKHPSAASCYAWQGCKTGLGFSPQTEGCVWHHLWQEDGFRCADLTCLQLPGFARPGLARACLCVPARDSHSSSLQAQEPEGAHALLPVPFVMSFSKPHWVAGDFFFFFLTCALYHRPQLQCPQQLPGDAGLRSGRGARFCACGMWQARCFHRLQVVPGILSPVAPFSASLQPRPARGAKTHAWEPLVSWDLKPLARVITQTRVCWRLQPLPPSLSGALGHDLLVLWLGCC